VGLFATDWPLLDKNAALTPLLERIPTYFRLVEHSPNGAINPNELAGVLLIPAVIGLVLSVSAASPMRRTAALASGGFCAVCLGITASRSGLLGLGVGLAVAPALSVWLSRNRPGVRGIAYAATALCALAAGPVLLVWYVGGARLQTETSIGPSPNLLSYNQATAEWDLTGLEAVNGTAARDLTRAWQGSSAIRVTVPAGASLWRAGTTTVNGAATPVVGGAHYAVSAYAYVEQDRDLEFLLDWYDARGQRVTFSWTDPRSISAGQWTRLVAEAPAPPGAARLVVGVGGDQTVVAETRYWLDALQVEAGDAATPFVPPDLTPAEVALTRNVGSRRLDNLLGARIEIWSRALEQFAARPLTGWGPGQFQVAFVADGYTYTSVPEGMFVAHAHDMFLEYLVTLGIPGAVTALLVLVVTLWSLRAVRTSCCLVASATALTAALVGFQVFGLTDALAEGGRGALVLWTTLGLAAAVASRAHRLGEMHAADSPHSGRASAELLLR
jgi:hypothetical protein